MRDSQGIQWVAGEETPIKTWITRVLNFGTWEEWQQLKASCTPDQIRDAVQNPLRGSWTKHGRAFAETLFDHKLPDEVLIRYDV
ncbi:MAG: hypothetical protein HY372_01315 [Candidatus Andersenbacteria bacterium]|nr:hypothetical protein [Candidatus Andersenbacteria bacterium]